MGSEGRFLSSVSGPPGVPRPLPLGETSEARPLGTLPTRGAQAQLGIPEKEEAASGTVLSWVRGQGPTFQKITIRSTL